MPWNVTIGTGGTVGHGRTRFTADIGATAPHTSSVQDTYAVMPPPEEKPVAKSEWSTQYFCAT